MSGWFSSRPDPTKRLQPELKANRRFKQRKMRRYPESVCLGGLRSDAELEFLGVVARVGVQVIGRAARELVALTQLAADDDTYGKNRDASGDETNIPQNDAAFFRGIVDRIFDAMPELTN